MHHPLNENDLLDIELGKVPAEEAVKILLEEVRGDYDGTASHLRTQLSSMRSEVAKLTSERDHFKTMYEEAVAE